MSGGDRHAVLIGVAQSVDRDADGRPVPNPVATLADIARLAAVDAHLGTDRLDELDTIGLVDTPGWSPTNGPSLVAEELGATPRDLVTTYPGGDTPVVLLNRVARDIVAERRDFALIAGANHLRSLKLARSRGQTIDWPTGGGPGAPERWGPAERGESPLEREYGLSNPISVYPLFENALRAQRSLSIEDHSAALGELMAPLSAVAAGNPYAWFPTARSPEEIATPTSTNRMISLPYTKYMSAVMDTEQAAGVLICSAEKAQRLGVPEDRWVYWAGGREATEAPWYPTDRPSFARCSAMGEATHLTLESAGIELDAVTAFDFYSCFPIAIEMACAMSGLAEDDPRGHTVTGGLPYAGGPGSNYTTHAIAAMVDHVRGTAEGAGLVTGNGWYMTKHAAVVLSAAPPGQPSNDVVPSASPDIPEEASATRPADGPAVVETYTVLFDRDGEPERGIIVGTTDAGQRFVANTPTDPDLLREMCHHEQIGRTGDVDSSTGRNVFSPHSHRRSADRVDRSPNRDGAMPEPSILALIDADDDASEAIGLTRALTVQGPELRWYHWLNIFALASRDAHGPNQGASALNVSRAMTATRRLHSSLVEFARHVDDPELEATIAAGRDWPDRLKASDDNASIVLTELRRAQQQLESYRRRVARGAPLTDDENHP